MATRARILVVAGFSGTGDTSGTGERDASFFLTAHTLRLHLQQRFPEDVIEVVCAWHKNVFVNALRAPGAEPDLKIRQIHYVGHGSLGGLYFGYKNPVAVAERQKLAELITQPPAVWLMNKGVRRRIALMWDAGLMSGFFTDALSPAVRADIKAQLTPDVLMHVWGCFAGAPSHTFDVSDPYWNIFNSGGAPVDGLARHIAKSLEIQTTACWDPDAIHGMDFCFRTSKGAFNCGDVRPDRLPHWLWPESRKVRWVTYDATGTGDESSINFLGTRVPVTRIPPGRPPTWLTDEIPLNAAKAGKPAFPVCSAAHVPV